jgi:protein-disulfide isomerase/uncharacterized membrane protein
MEKTKGSKKIWGWIAVFSAFVAIGLHGYLTTEFYQLKLGVGDGKSICNLGAALNCEVVAVSPYAAFLSIPMALWGLWTNALFALIALGGLLGISTPRRSSRLALVFATVIFAASVVMSIISATKLGTYCLFCIGAYATSIFVFAGSLLWAKDQEGSIGEGLREVAAGSKSFLGFFIAIPALAFISNRAVMDSYGAGQMGIIIQESLNDWSSSPAQEFDPTKGLTFQASTEEPKVTIVEFVDLLCPHCKAATPSIHAFSESRKDVRLIVKIFPLDGTCNPDTRMKAGDGLRCQWSYAVFCAEKLAKKGWEALDWVFESQANLFGAPFDPLFEKLTQSLQVSAEEMKTCIGQSDTHDLITAMAGEGSKGEIRGTPAIFVNGKRADRGQFLPVLEAIYQKAK